MPERNRAALARRLAAYSATAGIACAVAPGVAAQIVFTDVEPDQIVLPNQMFLLDFDDDGAQDLSIVNNVSYHAWFYFLSGDVPEPTGHPQNGFLALNDAPYPGAVIRLSAGSLVGPVSLPQAFSSYAYFAIETGFNHGQFFDEEGYAGFRFVAGDGQFHYGWLRIEHRRGFPGGFRGIIHEYAYEQAPETPIRAGAITRVSLEGDVNQTDFPPEGGPLRYAFTLTSTNAAPLALKVVARRDSAVAFREILWTGALPDGGALTDTVEVLIPPDLPGGTYDVAFTVGDPEREVPLGSQSFTVTKVSGVAAEPDAPDLPATHALSGAAPNPTTGRARLTLSVARTQAVRLTVHDALGRRVATLHDGALPAGPAHAFTLDALSLPAGVYAVRAVGEDFADVRTFTFTR